MSEMDLKADISKRGAGRSSGETCSGGTVLGMPPALLFAAGEDPLIHQAAAAKQ
jgi:hypothetical protein